MNLKTILFSALVVTAFFTAFSLYLNPSGQKREPVTLSEPPSSGSQSTPQGSPEASPQSPPRLRFAQPSKGVPAVNQGEAKALPRISLRASEPMASPIQSPLPIRPEPAPPAEEVSPVKLCGGKPISQCSGVTFSHFDFALLLLDILSMGTAEGPEEAFETLESLQVQPVGGWARTDPQRRMSSREMEEVRCALSLASEEGMIPVGPSVLTAAVNRFCQEVQVGLTAAEDAGVIKESRPMTRAETGYQGGTDGVASSPF